MHALLLVYRAGPLFHVKPERHHAQISALHPGVERHAAEGLRDLAIPARRPASAWSRYSGGFACGGYMTSCTLSLAGIPAFFFTRSIAVSRPPSASTRLRVFRLRAQPDAPLRQRARCLRISRAAPPPLWRRNPDSSRRCRPRSIFRSSGVTRCSRNRCPHASRVAPHLW